VTSRAGQAASIDNGTGIAVHCNDNPLPLAARWLEYHCEKRKYLQKAKAWFGICLASDGFLRFGINLEFPWKPDTALEGRIQDEEASPRRASKKVGRNDPCTCGSGKKYKKCCLE
jgi:SEC-C motif